MAIRALTDDPDGLLARIKKLIDQGHITTWSYDEEGDFTHTPTQWKGKAWLEPEVKADKLRLTILNNEKVPLTREIFAVYHGRFIEMLISHVADRYTSASATPNPASDEPVLA
jgi:hypothetical protein